MSKSDIVNMGEKVGKDAKHWFIWHACPNCGKERWIEASKPKSTKFTGLCRACSGTRNLDATSVTGQRNWRWRGGRFKIKTGYIYVILRPASPFYPMVAKIGYVMEHRLVMAQHLGRCLESWERVHHKNGIRDDNRLENLALTTQKKHEHNTLYWVQAKRIKELEELVKKLTQNG